jgi:uncharacterized protein
VNLELARTVTASGLENLERHRRRINALNVYPVPDGDTGTNLTATVRGITVALESSSAASPSEVADEIRRSALLSAKGNSGVILSQIVRGIADVIGGYGHVDGGVLAEALRSGATRAYQGVERPVEGTMLTVIREMAEEAEKVDVRTLAVEDALARAIERGDDAVRRTPELLDKLREAGVVDAGGAGLVEAFRGIHAGLTGQPLADAPVELDELSDEAIHQETSRYRYCTVFLVEGEGLDPDALRHVLDPLGDSLLVVGDDALVKVHVHTDTPDEALAVGRAVGVVDESQVEIGDMHSQASHRERWLAQLHAATQADPVETGLVVVAPGDGNREIFESMGATFVIEGGQTMNPSVAEIYEAITAVTAERVVVLPNNRNVVLAAENAARESTKDVRVIPTASVPEGLAATIAFDPAGTADENQDAMRAASEGVVTGEVTVASRDTTVEGVAVREGEWLGLVDHVPVASAPDQDVVTDAVLDRLLADGRSYLTVLYAEGAPAEDDLRARITARHPDVEVDVRWGGQPHYPLLLSAE